MQIAEHINQKHFAFPELAAGAVTLTVGDALRRPALVHGGGHFVLKHKMKRSLLSCPSYKQCPLLSASYKMYTAVGRRSLELDGIGIWFSVVTHIYTTFTCYTLFNVSAL
jgi:hypothetical protein